MSSGYSDSRNVLILFEKKYFLCSIIKICLFDCLWYLSKFCTGWKERQRAGYFEHFAKWNATIGTVF